MRNLTLCATILLFIAGCGTIINRTPRSVNLTSQPSGASFRVYDAAGVEVFTNRFTVSLFRFGHELTDRSYTLFNHDGSIHSFATRNSAGNYNFTNRAGESITISSDMYLYDNNRSLVEVRITNLAAHLTPTSIQWEKKYNNVSFSLQNYPTQTTRLQKRPSFISWFGSILFTGAGAGLYFSNNDRVMPATIEEFEDAKATNDQRIEMQKYGIGLMALGGVSLLVDIITDISEL
ncbi:MAG: hypothetical protein FWG98_05095 [Candidatus Cloacimonetes bacterium]|nr:hypothetical protein [Candidatus Cloacimonadota bacterium]